MPQGLQAWDASGNLVVDLGDYSTRFITSIAMNMPAQQDVVNVAVSGVTDAGHFAVITKGNSSTLPGVVVTEMTAITSNGSVYLVAQNKTSYARPVTVDIYAFQ